MEEGEIGSGSNSRVCVLGKRRCFPSTPPPLIQLTIKEDVPGEVVMGKKDGKVGVKGKGVVGVAHSPSWMGKEVSQVVDGIAGCEELLSQFREEVMERCSEKETLEVEVRRAKMMLSDRTIMLEEAKAEVEKISVEEVLVKGRLAKKMSLLKAEGISCSSDVSLSCDTEKYQELTFDRRVAERSVARSIEVIVGCQSAIAEIEERLLASSARHSLVVGRVSALADHVGRVTLLL